MKTLLSGVILAVLAVQTPADAKVCKGDALKMSGQHLPPGSLRSGQAAAFTGPNGCIGACKGGSHGKGRTCHWM